MASLLNHLIGLSLQGCRFSRSSTTFDFTGMVDGSYQNYELSTFVNVSFSKHDLNDAEENLSLGVWPILEHTLIEIKPFSDERGLELVFDSGDSIFIFSLDGHELYLCKNLTDSEWWCG